MKTITIILIFALLFSSMGCTRIVVNYKNKNFINLLEQKSEMIVYTKNYSVINLYRPNTYQFANDSIYVQLVIPASPEFHLGKKIESVAKRNLKIALKDVLKAEVKEFDRDKNITILISVIAVLVLTGIGWYWYIVNNFELRLGG